MVLVSPSTDIMLKESTTSARRAFCSISFEMHASVARNPSMVHILGWIMPEPLHMPPRVTLLPPSSNSTAICLGTVSVVMMAFAASAPASGPSAFVSVSFRMPSFNLSRGSCMPMTPVEATSTASPGIPSSSPAHSASARQQSIPCFPVQAFAMPELTTTAWA